MDFNVPLNEQQEVGDTSRIEGAKPTVDKILKDGGSAILMSHLGRPKGVDKKEVFGAYRQKKLLKFLEWR